MPFLNLPKKKPAPRKMSDTRKERQKIYDTTEWRKIRQAYLMEHPVCEECLKEGRITATNLQVHHITSFMNYDTELQRKQAAYDYNNLETVCQDCHNRLHGNVKKNKKDKSN